VGFVTGITALVGLVLAYQERDKAAEPFRSHFEHQIRMFWSGVIWLVVAAVTSVVGGFISAASVATTVTFGVAGAAAPAAGSMFIGLIATVVPFGVCIGWFVVMLMRIIKGMRALGNGQTI
jgi:uncharacterized membrane protein